MHWDGIESDWLQVEGLVRRRGSEFSDTDAEIDRWLKTSRPI
jgi:hypothetical protein